MVVVVVGVRIVTTFNAVIAVVVVNFVDTNTSLIKITLGLHKMNDNS